MPSLLILAPCQRIVHGDEEHDVSFISILEGVKIRVASGAEPPPGTTIPMTWYVFVCWKKDEDDQDRKYEQRILFMNPSGESMMETVPQEFYFDTRMVHVITRFSNFPISHQGICPLIVQIRELGQEQWGQTVSYPLLVEYEDRPPITDKANKVVIWHKI